MSDEQQVEPTESVLADTAVTETTQNVTENVTNSDDSWISQISEDYRDSFKEYKSLDDVAKSYKSLETMVGNSVRIPTEGASKEDFDAFYAKLSDVPGVARLPNQDDPESVNQFYRSLGRPENAEGYKLELGENVQIDESAMKNFKDLAHSIGLTNEQANKLAEFESSRYQAYEENLTDTKVEAEKVLKEEWGNDYNARLTGAKEVIKLYGDKYPEAIQDLVEGPAGNNPAFLSMLSELYGSLKETGTIEATTEASYGKTPDQAKLEIEDIMNNGAHPYNDESNPGHAEAVAAMQRLFQSAYPE